MVVQKKMHNINNCQENAKPKLIIWVFLKIIMAIEEKRLRKNLILMLIII